MEFKNYKLIKQDDQQIIEIEKENYVYDLHNAAEFLRIEYMVSIQELQLFWKYYFNEKDVKTIQLVFKETSSFKILPRDVEMPKDEDDCLEEIINSEEGFELKFMGGMRIIINAKETVFIG